MSNAVRFEIATADQEAAAAAQEYDLHIFELPGFKTDVEYYAAIRPASDAWLALSRTSYTARQNVTEMGIAGMKFIDECLTADDLREALLEADDGPEPKWLAELREQGLEIFDDLENPTGDGELSEFGLQLADSNNRINNRLTNRRDPFGLQTLIDIYLSFLELWSGNPTSSPQDYLPPQKPTGGKSTGTRSSKGSTSRRSSAGRRAGSAARSTSSSRAGSTSRKKPSSTSS